MDIQSYIQSGAVENYVLGLANAEETAEIEELRNKYVEIEDAINEFSIALEGEALVHAIEPPPEIKTKIIDAIKQDGDSSYHFISANEAQTTPVISMNRSSNWKMIAAASAILFIVSASLNFYLFSKYSANKDAYQALLSERETMQVNNQMYQTQLKEWQLAAVMMADTGMATVKMKSVNGKDDAATVFWNKASKDVYVMVNKLPEPLSGKQYQLWAMVNGTPVDAGLLDPSCISVCKMKNIPKAQAFAITLEKEGGNRVPNLKALYVMGSI